MNENPEQKQVYIECCDCVNSSLCASLLDKVITDLRKMGVIDFTLKIKSCSRYLKKEGDENGDNNEEEDFKDWSNLSTF